MEPSAKRLANLSLDQFNIDFWSERNLHCTAIYLLSLVFIRRSVPYSILLEDMPALFLTAKGISENIQTFLNSSAYNIS